MTEPDTALERVEPGPLTPETVLPAGVQPSRNYVAAIELGHVLAASGFYPDARDPAKAAVKVMIGMDLGLSPTAALQGIHVIEDKEGKVSFIIEGKLFAAVIKRTPGYDFHYIERSPERVEVEFKKRDEEGEWQIQEPTITWTLERAQKAGLTGKGLRMYEKYPTEMLTWRALAEGTRAHFPEIVAGQPVYAQEEFAGEEGDIREALTPQTAQPLTDERAEGLRAKARAVKDEIDALNPELVIPTRFAQAIAKAEHSHEQLENVVAGYEFLRDREKEFADLEARLREVLREDPDEADKIVERAKRRGTPQERVDALSAALAPPEPDAAQESPKGEDAAQEASGGE